MSKKVILIAGVGITAIIAIVVISKMLSASDRKKKKDADKSATGKGLTEFEKEDLPSVTRGIHFTLNSCGTGCQKLTNKYTGLWVKLYVTDRDSKNKPTEWEVSGRRMRNKANAIRYAFKLTNTGPNRKEGL